MFDLVIRGGSVVDGTGAAARTADVAIADGVIVEVGKVEGQAREVIDADGALVTPGFVDIHTHYDGQFLWDDTLDPSFSHGVTTAICGNCGVGFAPLRAEYRFQLMELMEGVEDIPGIVLDEGLDWDWQTFPEYLNRLDERRYTMDVASHITHAPLRVAVMGERALRHETATTDDVAAMARLVREAMDAGAVGFSCARLLEHLSSAGAHVPGSFAEEEEFLTLAKAMGQSGHGTVQIIPLGTVGDLVRKDGDIGREGRMAEHARMERLAQVSGRPVNYSLGQFLSDPDDWRMMVTASEQSQAAGLRIHPQINARPGGLLSMLDGHHIFRPRPSYIAVAKLPLAERVVALRDPDRRAAILGENDDLDGAGLTIMDMQILRILQQQIPSMIPLSYPIDFEPDPAQNRIEILAGQLGVTPQAYLYDHLTAGDGTNVVADVQLGYPLGNHHATYEMLKSPIVVSGLSDGGAHLSLICDATAPTQQLMFWVRDRTRGPRLPLELIVSKLTKTPADLYSLHDRGIISPGKRADVNVIDFNKLTLDLPRTVCDLPSGGRRLLQDPHGYIATIVKGTATRRGDKATGAKPGRLLRSSPSGPRYS